MRRNGAKERAPDENISKKFMLRVTIRTTHDAYMDRNDGCDDDFLQRSDDEQEGQSWGDKTNMSTEDKKNFVSLASMLEDIQSVWDIDGARESVLWIQSTEDRLTYLKELRALVGKSIIAANQRITAEKEALYKAVMTFFRESNYAQLIKHDRDGIKYTARMMMEALETADGHIIESMKDLEELREFNRVLARDIHAIQHSPIAYENMLREWKDESRWPPRIP